ncbi:MAG TPA: hypothetical protein VHO90_07190, partial [Bacteroidales bacterium]|nr:hypothetical protein [Bacteroidales bacterium]
NYNKAIELSLKYQGYSCGICYNNRGWTKKALGDIKGWQDDLKLAKENGYPDNYKSFSNLESCFYNDNK